MQTGRRMVLDIVDFPDILLAKSSCTDSNGRYLLGNHDVHIDHRWGGC